MKHLHKILTIVLGIACGLGLSFSSMAQTKIAYIDTDVVIRAMPEYKATQSQLETFQKQLVAQLDAQKKSIAQYYTKVIEQVKRGELTTKQQQEAELKLQQMQTDLQEKTADADKKILAKEKVLSEPMYDKFEKGIASVAQKNGYMYIFDKKLLMYATGGIDATAKLKKELGM